MQLAKVAQATDDVFLLQLMTGQSNGHGVAAAATTKKMMPAVMAVVDSRDQKQGKKTTKTAKPLSRSSVDAYNKMKVLSISYERHLHTSTTAAATAACDEDEKVRTMLKDATKALHTIWDEGASLKTVFASSLEEPLMHLLLILATTHGGVPTANSDNNSTGHYENSDNHSSIDLSKKLFQQLVSVDRFTTVAQLTFFGNDALKQAVRDTVDQFMALEPPPESKLLIALSKWKSML